jgi:hypothetical protein
MKLKRRVRERGLGGLIYVHWLKFANYLHCLTFAEVNRKDVGHAQRSDKRSKKRASRFRSVNGFGWRLAIGPSVISD